MSLTSLVTSVLAFPSIITFPSENITPIGKLALASTTVLFGALTTLVTNFFASGYVCKAFVSKTHPNIMEFTTVGFTGKYLAFRFDLSDETSLDVERPLTTFKHVASDMHFYVVPECIQHPAWSMILPHLFEDGDDESEGENPIIDEEGFAVDENGQRLLDENGQEFKPPQPEPESAPIDAPIDAESAPVDAAVAAEAAPVDTKVVEAQKVDEAKVEAVKLEEAAPKVEAPKVVEAAKVVVEAPKVETPTPTPIDTTKIVNNVVDHKVAAATAPAAEAINKAVPPAPKTEATPKH